MVNAKQLQKQIAAHLLSYGIEEADYEAKLLVESVGSLTAVKIMMGEAFPEAALPRLNALVQKRLSGIPLQYLLGEWEFFGLSFAVGEGVLIPRQDTEALVETALTHLQQSKDAKMLDLCSGSGCIPIAITANIGCNAYAVEYSDKAYAYLTKNIARHMANVTPILADALAQETIDQFADASLDCITSNPPYLNERDMQELQKEVRFEPEDALYAPENGYYFYRLIPKLWKDKLKPGGMLAFEVGIHQADTVKAFLAENGYTGIGYVKDLAGIERVVYAYKES